jgi:Acyltransferase family
MRMRRLVLTTVLPVRTTVLGATPEAQQLPRSGEFTGWNAVLRGAVSSYTEVQASQTLASRLVETKNRPSGFDYMRLILALGVIWSHSRLLTNDWGNISPFFAHISAPFIAFLLPMFFALSGFLVAGSLERSNTLVTFLGLRVFRIMPALTVEVLLSALVLGPMLTTLPFTGLFFVSEI